MERRRNPGRRDNDPASIKEATWQEACGHDRKVIRLLQEGYEKFTRNTVIALAVLAMFVGFAVWRDFVLGGENAQRIKDIQAERFSNALSSCETTNLRNKGTIAELNTLVGKAVSAAGVSKAQIAQIRANQVSTVLLIDSLAPFHQSCSLFAQQAVGGGPTR